MKIVFFGTPDYVLPVLKAIHKKFVTGPGISPIIAVVTRSPKPVGRKQVLEYSPVDKWAHERGIETFYSANDLLEANLDFDLGILASYGEIIKKEVIDLFSQGILVIHPSLLPKYRGASPIQSAIADGLTETGLTVLKMDEKMDHGPIVSQFKEEIFEDDTFESLRNRIFEKSADFVTDLIPVYVKQKVKPKIQDESQATYTKMVSKEDGRVDLEKDTPEAIERKIRAYNPWPGVWCYFNEKRLKILKAHLELGRLIIDEVQLEGKNPVSYKQFQEAYGK
jgi:methionyl-tRNA formyltransferase